MFPPRGAISFENRLLLRANSGRRESGRIPRRCWSVRGRKVDRGGKRRRGGCSRLHNCTVHSANVSILSINPWYKSNLSSGRRGGGGIPRGVDGNGGELRKVKRWKRGECKQSPARSGGRGRTRGLDGRKEGRKEGRNKSFPLATRRPPSIQQVG